jgi:hypothetical protein
VTCSLQLGYPQKKGEVRRHGLGELPDSSEAWFAEAMGLTEGGVTQEKRRGGREEKS